MGGVGLADSMVATTGLELSSGDDAPLKGLLADGKKKGIEGCDVVVVETGTILSANELLL